MKLGRMEADPDRLHMHHPCCALQHLDIEDLSQAMCDAILEGDKKLVAPRMQEESLRLHNVFVRAHGRPKGEVTTLTTGCSPFQGGKDFG